MHFQIILALLLSYQYQVLSFSSRVGSRMPGMGLDIWIDCRRGGGGGGGIADGDSDGGGFKTFGSSPECDYVLENGARVLRDGEVIGGYVFISGDEGQKKATSLVGSVEWIVCEFSDWAMIPLENIISVCNGSGTKVAAMIRDASEASGAGFALQLGVDALVIEAGNRAVLEAAQIVKSQRGEEAEAVDATPIELGTDDSIPHFSTLRVVDVSDGGVGDRFCVDLTSMLHEGEGMLLSSTSKSMLLVHGETIRSSYVPSRDFRVNAGSPEAYVKVASGKTKYLSELKSNDGVLVVSSRDGATRFATVGRLKIERRPFLRIEWVDEEDNARSGHIFLQQAETVRVVDAATKMPISITSLEPGMKVLGTSDTATRHLGVPISAKSEER